MQCIKLYVLLIIILSLTFEILIHKVTSISLREVGSGAGRKLYTLHYLEKVANAKLFLA